MLQGLRRFRYFHIEIDTVTDVSPYRCIIKWGRCYWWDYGIVSGVSINVGIGTDLCPSPVEGLGILEGFQGSLRDFNHSLGFVRDFFLDVGFLGFYGDFKASSGILQGFQGCRRDFRHPLRILSIFVGLLRDFRHPLRISSITKGFLKFSLGFCWELPGFLWDHLAISRILEGFLRDFSGFLERYHGFKDCWRIPWIC